MCLTARRRIRVIRRIIQQLSKRASERVKSTTTTRGANNDCHQYNKTQSFSVIVVVVSQPTSIPNTISRKRTIYSHTKRVSNVQHSSAPRIRTSHQHTDHILRASIKQTKNKKHHIQLVSRVFSFKQPTNHQQHAKHLW